MAVVAPTITEVESLYGHVHSVVWAAMANGDTGTPYQMPGSGDRSAHAFGTFGVGGSMTMQGSNELLVPAAAATTWVSLHDPQGLAFTMTAAKIEEVAEVSNWIRPNVTAGDGTTAITVAMIVRRST